MILEQLGVYGWRKQDENLVLTSLLTGDPLLMRISMMIRYMRSLGGGGGEICAMVATSYG